MNSAPDGSQSFALYNFVAEQQLERMFFACQHFNEFAEHSEAHAAQTVDFDEKVFAVADCVVVAASYDDCAQILLSMKQFFYATFCQTIDLITLQPYVRPLACAFSPAKVHSAWQQARKQVED